MYYQICKGRYIFNIYTLFFPICYVNFSKTIACANRPRLPMNYECLLYLSKSLFSTKNSKIYANKLE